MKVEIVTPRGLAVSTDADEVTAPGVRGEFGVLPGHTPFIAALKPGVLSFRKGGKREVLAVGAGFAEVSGKDRVVVLTQQAADTREADAKRELGVQAIDAAQAQRDLEEAERALKDGKFGTGDNGGGPTREEWEARRAWAQARLDARSAARS
ncbi:MAG TPA: ATP synthase F1 subunit epsilon [Polyangia bacterium]|nr:ATP synthase F1 subunit epsilon [Polyangia bacterium]